MKSQNAYKIVNTRFYHIKEKIPEEWSSDKIQNITKLIQSGISRLLSPYDIGYVMLTSQNIQKGTFDNTNKKYWYKIDNQGVDLTKYILNEGDIILNFINSIAQIGKSCVFKKQDRDWIFTTNVFRIKTDHNKIGNEFFNLMLQTNFFLKQMFAITQPAINQASFSKTDFNKIILFYPKMEEQQKIASIISKIDELIQKTDQIIEQTQRLKKGLIQRLLTKGIGHTKFKMVTLGLKFLKLSIPSEWSVVTLDEISKLIDTPHYTSQYIASGVPVIRTSDCQPTGEINYANTKFTSEYEFQKRKRIINPKIGDVLYTREAPPGLAAIVDKEEISIGQRIVLLKPMRDRLIGEFLVLFLNSSLGFLQSDAKIVKTTVEHVNIVDY